MTVVSCPHCGTRLNVRSIPPGSVIACSACGGEMRLAGGPPPPVPSRDDRAGDPSPELGRHALTSAYRGLLVERVTNLCLAVLGVLSLVVLLVESRRFCDTTSTLYALALVGWIALLALGIWRVRREPALWSFLVPVPQLGGHADRRDGGPGHPGAPRSA